MFGKNQYRADQHYEPVPFDEQVAAVGQLIAEGKVGLWAVAGRCRMPGCCACNCALPPCSSATPPLQLAAILTPTPSPLPPHPFPCLPPPPPISLQVRHWGLSNETPYGVCRMCEAAVRLGLPLPISIQNDFSLLDRRFEGNLAEACAPHHWNLGLLPYGPLAGGTLTDKYFGGGQPGPNARHVKVGWVGWVGDPRPRSEWPAG